MRTEESAPTVIAPGWENVRMVVKECVRHQIGALTLFAFSSENWHRPRDEVLSLMSLFVESLEVEIAELHRSGVRVRFIGERSELDERLRATWSIPSAPPSGTPNCRCRSP